MVLLFVVIEKRSGFGGQMARERRSVSVEESPVMLWVKRWVRVGDLFVSSEMERV